MCIPVSTPLACSTVAVYSHAQGSTPGSLVCQLSFSDPALCLSKAQEVLCPVSVHRGVFGVRVNAWEVCRPLNLCPEGCTLLLASALLLEQSFQLLPPQTVSLSAVESASKRSGSSSCCKGRTCFLKTSLAFCTSCLDGARGSGPLASLPPMAAALLGCPYRLGLLADLLSTGATAAEEANPTCMSSCCCCTRCSSAVVSSCVALFNGGCFSISSLIVTWILPSGKANPG